MGQDHDYVHGYAATAQARLCDQAATLESRLHRGARYPAGGTVLEAGSGVGAQTIPLLRQNPDAVLTCVDIAAASLAEALTRIRAAGLPVPALRQADLKALPFPRASFDQHSSASCWSTFPIPRRSWPSCAAWFGRAGA